MLHHRQYRCLWRALRYQNLFLHNISTQIVMKRWVLSVTLCTYNVHVHLCIYQKIDVASQTASMSVETYEISSSVSIQQKHDVSSQTTSIPIETVKVYFYLQFYIHIYIYISNCTCMYTYVRHLERGT